MRTLALLPIFAAGACPLVLLPNAFAQIDRNSNGFSDVWEAAYGSGLAPNVDLDVDGFTNREEALAGTNPHDPLSFPRASVFTLTSTNEVTVRFPSVAGVLYQVEASGDFATWHPAGAPVVGTGLQMELRMPLRETFVGSALSRSVWTNLTGYSLSAIKNYAASGVPPPSYSDSITSLDLPQTDPDQNQFGQFIRGWLVAPETGSYTFWIASDDGSELWISTNSSPAGKTLAATVTGWTGYQEWTKYGPQQSAPRVLEQNRSYYFEVFQREAYGGDHLSVAWTLPGRPANERTILAAPHFSSTGQNLGDLAQAGQRLAFRLNIRPTDSDGDGVTDFEERMLGLDPLTPTTTPRKPDGEAALQILDSPSQVTLGATTPRGYEAQGAAGRFTLYRSGGIQPLSVSYTVSGSATAGADFAPLSGSVNIPPGARSTTLDVVPVADGVAEPPESVVITLLSNATYAVGSPAQATVTIDDAEDVLFVATLRPPAGVLSSGSGLGSVRRAGNGWTSSLSLSFSGLTAAQTASEVYVSSNGLGGTVVLSLPLDQIALASWSFDGTNGLSRDAVLAALDQEQMWVRIRSAAFPGGELTGRLVRSPGWQTMPTPPAPPSAPSQPENAGEAARFLTQATFGPTEADVALLQTNTYERWINAQLALPPTHHMPYVQARRAELMARDDNDGWQMPRQEAWWQHALAAPDQLRQRMAWALSQILVISQFGALDSAHLGTTLYYDQLLDHAFGNYRDLLETVTLSPMMGTYLSMMRNQKPNPLTGHEPDENYAREVMQLFSIGLSMLHPDGSLQLDAQGMPIPTYTQADIVGLAHVFTGWSAHFDPADPPRWDDGSLADPYGWFFWGWDDLRPMSFYPEFHDTQDRSIVGGTLIPAGTNGVARLEAALDALFNHPNVGPFLARQLIQRFVTSNPSPGYIFRVASVFNNNGAGVRGDLGATLKAVLLDPEARGHAVRTSASHGKPAEPVLRMTRLLRLVTPTPPFIGSGDNRFFVNFQWSLPEQAPLYSPSVFNFFQPVFRNPGRIARAGLLSPEFQIFAETTAINQANLNFSALYWGLWTPEPDGAGGNVVLTLNVAPLVALLQTPGLTPAQAQALLIDRLNQRVLFGAMSPGLRSDIEFAFASLPNWFGYTADRQRERVLMAMYLVFNSPEFFVQR